MTPDESRDPVDAAAADGEPSEPIIEPAARARQLRWVLADAILPGVGHLAAGRRRLALLFGLPTLAALLALLALVVTTSFPRLAAEAVNALGVILAIQGMVLVWRLLAVGAGLFAVGWRRPSARHGIAVAILLLAVVLPQGYLGYVTNVAREEVDRVFVVDTGGAWQPPSTPQPTLAPEATASPTPEPTATPAVPRVNILLIGIDSGVGRRTANTDTMIVASLDPVTETVSMISIPRDMVNVPLPDGTVYGPKLNGLDSYARHHPSTFPGSDGTGHDVLMAAIGTLLHLKIDYYASVSLGSFVQVVDILGGVDVSVSKSLCDPGYTEYGFNSGFSIKAGLRHLNGLQALAYARIRKAPGESDFTRAARQQEVISGLRDAVVKRGFLSDPVKLLQALGRAMATNVPRDILPDLADVMARVDRTHTYRDVITSPQVRPGFDARGSIQIPDIAGIRKLAATLFPETGTLPLAAFAAPPPATSGSGSGTGSCAPAPTKAPPPTPVPSATVEPSPSSDLTPAPTAPSPEPSVAPTP
ncbi:MAG: LCP family protein [Chloroflexota bacterium]